MKNILSFVEKSKQNYLDELKTLLAIPSVSSQSKYNPDTRKCAEWVRDQFKKIGMTKSQIFETPGHPIVYSELISDPKKPTILFYGHYDVQPVDPINLWTTPPFESNIRDGNLFARGSADDKGQIFIHFKAIEAILKHERELPINIKMLIEGEEEVGSVNLENFVKANKKMLKADLVLISDSAMYAKGLPSICYGLRGLAYMEIEVVGPNRDLHSGSFGGAVHNPIQALSEIIASLHDEKGRVNIPGFYNDVQKVTSKERQAFKRLPFSDKKYMKDLGVGELYGEVGYSTNERTWVRPTLECNGIWGGYIEQGAKTVLPSKASAKISMRLVPNQSSKKMEKLFTNHIKKIAPKSVKVTVKALHGGEAVVTPLESAGVKAAASALNKAFGKKPLFQREGGSIPIVVQFKHLLGLDTVLLGFGLPDENAHSPDEHLNLDNFFGGIRTAIYFYYELKNYIKKT
ncbi:MAG: dipeptidase [Bacteroidetes bacterium]|nr:dipeptidase [Bacteroidota bacterium]